MPTRERYSLPAFAMSNSTRIVDKRLFQSWINGLNIEGQRGRAGPKNDPSLSRSPASTCPRPVDDTIRPGNAPPVLDEASLINTKEQFYAMIEVFEALNDTELCDSPPDPRRTRSSGLTLEEFTWAVQEKLQSTLSLPEVSLGLGAGSVTVLVRFIQSIARVRLLFQAGEREIRVWKWTCSCMSVIPPRTEPPRHPLFQISASTPVFRPHSVSAGSGAPMVCQGSAP